MRRAFILLGMVLGLLAASTASAADVVKTRDSKVEGMVTATSPTEVTVSQNGTTKAVPVNEIEWITFDEEPTPLQRARTDVSRGQFEAALKAVDTIKLDEVARDEIKQDIEFLSAISTARLALQGEVEFSEAEKLLTAFLSAHPKSYHQLEASEVLGELLMAAGQFAKARECYERVGKAPWPEYKLRAAVAVGQILLAEKKPQEAMKFFQYVLDSKAEDDQAAAQRSVAALGKARCLADASKPDEAIKIAEEVIAKADAEDAELLGRAYLVLGIAQRKAGRSQDALYALLHVDAMYSVNRETHAEALYHLVGVWSEVKKPGRSDEARRTLAEEFGDTRWAEAIKQ